MNFLFSFLSLGFGARFLLAFVIIAFLYSKNKNDPDIKKGFTVLVVSGGAILSLCVIATLVIFIISGTALLGDALVNFRINF